MIRSNDHKILPGGYRATKLQHFCSLKLGPFTIQPAHFYFLIMQIYCLQRNDTKYYIIPKRHTQNNAKLLPRAVERGAGGTEHRGPACFERLAHNSANLFLEIAIHWPKQKLTRGPGVNLCLAVRISLNCLLES